MAEKRVFVSVECIWGRKSQLPGNFPKVALVFINKSKGYSTISFHYCNNPLREIVSQCLFYRQGN